MVLLKIFFSCVLAYSAPQETFQTRKIKVGHIALKVAIADTTAKRTQGLMFVENWDKYSGMLFLFPSSRKRVFWMKNTFLNLSLGYFDENKRLFEITDLHPPKSLAQTKVERARSGKPAKYVLEVPMGWFDKNKVQIGATLEGIKETSL